MDTPEYGAWRNMIQRCTNPKKMHWPYYGARGITVCAEWMDPKAGFDRFVRDMGLRPSKAHSLDRRNNDLGYSKSNCRWADRFEQQNNRRKTRWVVYRGERMPLADAARLAGRGVYSRLAAARVNVGWPTERAVETPRMVR